MARLNIQIHISPSATSFFLKSVLSAAFCIASAVSVQAGSPAQDQPQTTGDESWTKTKDSAAPNFNPSRTTASHTKSGNRTVDKQTLEVLGINGRYQPSSETETETIQVDAVTIRTIVRTYRWDASGQRTLAQQTEEEARTAADGNARVERKTSNRDVNGNFQVVRREVAETKKLGSNAEETKTTTYQRDSYGGLIQAEQTQEVKTQSADDSVAVKKTTLAPDGNGSWKVSAVTEKSVKKDGQSRTTEERISRPDINGRLNEASRTVSKESQSATGEETSTVETYDGGTQLRHRTTSIKKRDSGGEVTEVQVEQPNIGNPSDGTRVTGRTKYVVKYAGPGTQQSTTSEIRDANGNFQVISVDTQKSTQPRPQAAKPPEPPAKPNPDAPADKPPGSPPDKP